MINAKSKDYQKSIEYYDKAISAGEDVALSAINAAVSAFRLGDMDKYQYYINIANTYANSENQQSPAIRLFLCSQSILSRAVF